MMVINFINQPNLPERKMMQNVIRIIVLTMTVCFLANDVQGFTALAIQPKLFPQQRHHSIRYPCFVHEDSSFLVSLTSRTASRTFIILAKKDSNNDTKKPSKMSSSLLEQPGGFILLLFVGLFGLDLLLNIIFLTKRSLEFFVFGQAPSQETWF
jgi:hypothetical protein